MSNTFRSLLTYKSSVTGKTTQQLTKTLQTTLANQFLYRKNQRNPFSKQCERKFKGKDPEEMWGLGLLGFFLAVHNLQLKTANKIIQRYELLKKIVSELILQFEDNSATLNNIEYQKQNSTLITVKTVNKLNNPTSPFEDQPDSTSYRYTNHKNAGKVQSRAPSAEMKNQKKENIHLEYHKDQAYVINTTPQQNFRTQNFNIRIIRLQKEIEFMRKIVSSDKAKDLNSNLLKVALNQEEDKIAAFIVARFDIMIDEKTVIFAIQRKCLTFIHNIFFYKKNVLESDSTQSHISQIDQDFKPVQETRFTLDKLLFEIDDYYQQKESERIIKKVLKWDISYEDMDLVDEPNILQILCDLGHERVAAIYINKYKDYADSYEFFIKCVVDQRQQFLKYALKNQYFPEEFMNEERTIQWILKQLKAETLIQYCMNLLVYADFKQWTLQQLKQINLVIFNRDLILVIKAMMDTSKDQNHDSSVFLTLFNPLLVMSLIIEYLQAIKNDLINDLSLLGEQFIKDLKYDKVQQIFMEKDFKDRSVLNIITENNIQSYVNKEQISYLLEQIWRGKNFLMIDAKDFGCATFLMLVFFYINYSYVNLFKASKYNFAQTYEEREEIIARNLEKFNDFNFVGIILSMSYILNFFERLIYNYFQVRKSRKPIPLDIWIIFDLITGIANIIAFYLIGNAEPEHILDPMQKRTFDYYMNIIMVASWLRYFTYFLIINSVAKVTLTLFRMIWQTFAFLTIILCYMVLITTIFATLFRDVTTEDSIVYKSLSTTFRQMFDDFVSNFSQKQMSSYTTSHSILLIAHVTISFLFLMNYLVAILSTVYDIMIKNGEFYTIKHSYKFILKYINALSSRGNGYEKFILYPPPLNFVLIPLIIVSPLNKIAQRVSHITSEVVFWIENALILVFFLMYLILLDFKIYPKVMGNILQIDDELNKFCFTFTWIILGPFYLILLNFYDCMQLVNIFCMEKSKVFKEEEEDKLKEENHKYHIYKELIKSIKRLKDIAQNNTEVFKKKQQLKKLYTQNRNLLEKIVLDNNERKVEELFIVKRELIVAVYAIISSQNAYIKKFRSYYKHIYKRSKTRAMQFNASFDVTLNSSRSSDREKEIQLDPEFVNRLNSVLVNEGDDKYEDFQEFTENNIQVREALASISFDERLIINEFLSRFEIYNKNQQHTRVYLKLALKCFPINSTKYHLKKLDQINFARMQRVLIAFHNSDQASMFRCYDQRQKARYNQLDRKASRNSKILTYIIEHVDLIGEHFLNQHKKNFDTLREIQEQITLTQSTFKDQEEAEEFKKKMTLISQDTRQKILTKDIEQIFENRKAKLRKLTFQEMKTLQVKTKTYFRLQTINEAPALENKRRSSKFKKFETQSTQARKKKVKEIKSIEFEDFPYHEEEHNIDVNEEQKYHESRIQQLELSPEFNRKTGLQLVSKILKKSKIQFLQPKKEKDFLQTSYSSM